MVLAGLRALKAKSLRPSVKVPVDREAQASLDRVRGHPWKPGPTWREGASQSTWRGATVPGCCARVNPSSQGLAARGLASR